MFLKFMLHIITLFILFAGVLDAQGPKLPFDIPDSEIRHLNTLVNKSLQLWLERNLKGNPEWWRLISANKMAVGLVDMSDPHCVKYARVNGDVMMYAASLPKLGILLAGFQSLEDGTLKETKEIFHDMRIMISHSDNAAATRMIDRLGFERINGVLMDPKYQLYDTSNGGGLWVGKKYSKQGDRYPDPLKGLSHAATVTQVCRFYYFLAMGKLVNFERSRQMLDILSDPELHHKFVNSYDKMLPEAKLYRKSGTWRKWHSDSALILGPGKRCYVVVTLVEDSDGEQICRDLVPVIDEIMKSQ